MFEQSAVKQTSVEEALLASCSERDIAGHRGRARCPAVGAPAFAGRDDELGTAMRGLVSAVAANHAEVVLVEGELGVGKSRLIEEIGAAAVARGFTVVSGGADELRQLLPLSPLLSALDESPRSLADPVGMRTGPDPRLWLVDALRSRLIGLAARGPLMIGLDDLQWADQTTLLALRALSSQLDSYPIVWVLSRLAGAGGHQLDRLTHMLVNEGALRVELGPLPDPAAVAILTEILGAAPGDDVLALAAGAGGNPFLLVELAKALSAEGVVELDGGLASLVSDRVPDRLRSVVARRLGTLDRATAQLVEVAAMLGSSFAVEDLAEIMCQQPVPLLPMLREALAAGLLAATDDVLTWRHDLVRRAVLEGVPASVRRAVHRQIGGILAARAAIPGTPDEAPAMSSNGAADLAVAPLTVGQFGDWQLDAAAAEDRAVEWSERGRDTLAVEWFRRALHGYEQAGAERDTARVRGRLRQLGVHIRHWTHADRPVSGWDSLTDTERAVAERVATGLTNRQVAGEMFVSAHTVSFHLRHVFRKLGIGSRVELARLVVERAVKSG